MTRADDLATLIEEAGHRIFSGYASVSDFKTAGWIIDGPRQVVLTWSRQETC
jgi:hypothetical protein